MAEAARRACDRGEEEAAYERFLAYILAPRKTYRYFLDLLGDPGAAWRKTVDRYHDGADGETWAGADERLRGLLRDADEYEPLSDDLRLPDPPR